MYAGQLDTFKGVHEGEQKRPASDLTADTPPEAPRDWSPSGYGQDPEKGLPSKPRPAMKFSPKPSWRARRSTRAVWSNEEVVGTVLLSQP